MQVFGQAKLRLGAIFSSVLLGCGFLSTPADSAPTAAKGNAEVLKNGAPASKSAPKATAENGSINVWKLDQRSRILGDETVYVCPTAIKAVNRRNGVTILFVAPFTEVLTFSTKTRRVCRQTFEKSENPYARAVAMFSGIAHGQVPMNKVRDYSKGGLLWSDFAIPDKYKTARIALWKKKEVNSSEPASGYMTGFHLPMEKRALDWLARLYCVPKTGVIPFDVVFEDVDAEPHSLVKTFSMASAKLAANDLKCPNGLQTVKDPRAVDVDEASNDAFEMMMGPDSTK